VGLRKGVSFLSPHFDYCTCFYLLRVTHPTTATPAAAAAAATSAVYSLPPYLRPSLVRFLLFSESTAFSSRSVADSVNSGAGEGGGEGRGKCRLAMSFFCAYVVYPRAFPPSLLPSLPPSLPPSLLTNKELRKDIQHSFKGIRRALKFIHGQIHASGSVGGAPTFIDQVFVGVLTRVLLGAKEELREGREGGREGKKKICETLSKSFPTACHPLFSSFLKMLLKPPRSRYINSGNLPPTPPPLPPFPPAPSPYARRSGPSPGLRAGRVSHPRAHSMLPLLSPW